MPRGPDPQFLRHLLETFNAELDEKAQQITACLLKLEKGVAGDEASALLEEIFRAAHNVKGAARGVGVEAVAEISHHLETLFGKLKRENVHPAPELIDLSLQSLDRMREALSAFGRGEPAPFDVGGWLARLDGFGGAQAPAEFPPPASPALSEGAHAAVPGSDQPEALRVRLEKLDRIGAFAEDLQAARIDMQEHLQELYRLRAELEVQASLWSGMRPALRREAAHLPEDIRRACEAGATAASELNARAQRICRDFRANSGRLAILAESLQSDVHLLRLVPAATLLQPLGRIVRDLARELGKTVELEVAGSEIEMDRTVIEGVRDPLMHLVRNAVDHGIEDDGTRSRIGKPAAGRIEVRVRREGGETVLTVRDDGAGIDLDKLSAVALKKNFVTAAELEAMAPEQRVDLVFRSGLSTREMITSISGRGVGLDVVRSQLRVIRGRVQVQTEAGRGTCFTLRLPFTLSADRGLLVRCSGAVYAIPIHAVDQIMDLLPAEIVEVEATQAVLIRGRAIPLRDLAQALDFPARASRAATFPVVVLSSGQGSVALLVDEIIGEREIVIKPLRPPLRAVRNVVGGAAIGAGAIVMVLNPDQLMESALRPGAHGRVALAGESAEEAPSRRILVVDDSITTRTLEKNILEARGYLVKVAANGLQGWETLQQEGPFDLVITDVQMPVMDGFELAGRIKQSAAFAEVPVIIVTSLANDADRRRGIEVGADAYIVKSEFETKVLLDVVEQLILPQ